MKQQASRHTTCSRRPAADGFSLVEVTVAIGIFAFVAVGILGLLPAALKQRSDSAKEMRAVLIAEELLASVRASPNLRTVTFRDGPGLKSGNNRTVNILTRPAVLGFPSQTTVPFWSYDKNPNSSWSNSGGSDAEVKQSAVNSIETMARLSARLVTNSLYEVMVEVRSPAVLPLAKSPPVTFTTLVYSP